MTLQGDDAAHSRARGGVAAGMARDDAGAHQDGGEPAVDNRAARTRHEHADAGRTRAGRGGSEPSGMQRSAREVALDVLLAVEDADAYANLLLPARLDAAGMRGPDAALATQLTYGTLRGQGRYDWIIAATTGRHLETLDACVLAALRLGAHQLLDTRIKPHAAVNETVTLVRRRAGRGAAGFVNANLRAIGKLTAAQWLERIAAETPDPHARLAATTSHPQWIVAAFAAALEREGRGDELAALLDADNAAPRVHLTALPGFAAREELAAAHPGELGILEAAPTALELVGGDPAALAEVAAGRARVQDAGSQLVALTLSRARPLQPGERILDLCAGPGGKAALLAAEALAAGAHFEANEIGPTRAALVRQALAPLGEFMVAERDGRDYADTPGRYHRILLDAPCTGLGALRRRPEARWRKRAEDVSQLATLQRELLDVAITATAPGGLIAYVTCSPHQAETTQVVQDALARHPVRALDTRAAVLALAPTLDLARIPLHPVADEHEDAAPGTREPAAAAAPAAAPAFTPTAVQLWPHRHGTDAMFLALLQKDPA